MAAVARTSHSTGAAPIALMLRWVDAVGRREAISFARAHRGQGESGNLAGYLPAAKAWIEERRGAPDLERALVWAAGRLCGDSDGDGAQAKQEDSLGLLLALGCLQLDTRPDPASAREVEERFAALTLWTLTQPLFH